MNQWLEGLQEDLRDLQENRVLRISVDIVITTISPALLGVWARPVWFETGWNRNYWLVAFGFWLIVYVILRLSREQSEVISQTKLRHILLDMRRLLILKAQKIANCIQQIQTGSLQIPDKESAKRILRNVLDFETTRHEILRQIFLCFSNRNEDLNKHFYVSFMEAEDDTLAIVDFANSEDSTPISMAVKKRFQKREGCAGWAWETKDIFVVEDIERFKRQKAQGKLGPNSDYWIDVHPLHGEIAKSAVGIPVLVRTNSTEKVIGIISIHSDARRSFKRTKFGKRQIRIKSFPYAMMLAYEYMLRDLIDRL